MSGVVLTDGGNVVPLEYQPVRPGDKFNILSFAGDDTAFPGQTISILVNGEIGTAAGSVRLLDSDETTSVAQSVVSWNRATREIVIVLQPGRLPYGDPTQKVRIALADGSDTQTYSGIQIIPEAGVGFQDITSTVEGDQSAADLMDRAILAGDQIAWRDINTLGIGFTADGQLQTTDYGSFYLAHWDSRSEQWSAYRLVTVVATPEPGTSTAPRSIGPIEGYPDIFPDSMDWELQFRDQTFTSDLNGIESSLELPGAKWKVSMTFGQREGREGRLLAAFLASQKGKVGRFNVTPATFAPPTGTAEGQPRVRGSSQTGNTLVTDGWLGNQPEALAVGDYFSVNGELKLVTDVVSADAAGVAIVAFTPNLHHAPPDNAEIRVTRPHVRVKLSNNARWQLNHPVLYGITLNCVEALDV
jgi:hypothetical protein